MAFPSPASDGPQVIVGNVTYSYNASKTAWYRVGTVSNPITSTVDYYTGDGVTDTFALTAVPTSENYTFVAVGGVLQPRDRYSILGTYLTFSSIPPAGVPIDITTFGGSGASIYSNNSVATYLMNYTGNVTANSIIADSFYWSNGAPFISSIYGNANVISLVADTTFNDVYTNKAWVGNIISYSGYYSQGNILPTYDSAYDIGSSNYKFRSLYLSGNTIFLGNSQIGSISSNNTVTISNSLIVNGEIIDGSGVAVITYANILNAAMAANIAAANATIVSTNAAMTANVTAANAAIVTANSSMKSYVDSQVISASGYSNVAAAAFLSVAAPVYVGNIKSNTNIVANGNIIGGGVRSTAGTTPPANPVPGDVWFNTTENLLYRYISDGTRNVWLDISGPTYTFDWQNTVTFAGNLTPSANLTYYIGNDSQQYVGVYAANVVSTQIYNTGTATVGNIITTDGVFWSNGNAYSAGGGVSAPKTYGLTVAFGIGL